MLLASCCSSTCPGADASKGRTQLIARLAIAAARGTATYVSMLGMPVENQAVARSPQGMAIAGAAPPGKSTSRQLCASGTSSITPFRRTRPLRWPSRNDCASVRAVPGLIDPPASNASTRWVASGRTSLSVAAMQSVGITLKPTPGQITISSSLCFGVAAVRRKKDVDLAGDIEIVSLIVQAGVNHRRTGGCERAGTVRYDRHIRQRRYSRRRIINVKDPCGQTEFGGQFLDWTGTLAGEHWVQTLPLGLRGYEMARIAIGAVNHPLGAVRHSQLAIAARASIGLSNPLWVYAIDASG